MTDLGLFLIRGLSTGNIRWPAIRLSFNEWLIKATFHNEYELVVQLIDSDDFDEAIIHDIGILDTPFPIYYISMCYKQSLEEDFVESINFERLVIEHGKGV